MVKNTHGALIEQEIADQADDGGERGEIDDVATGQHDRLARHRCR
jgi:hypothetical protein